ncbi:MAG: hypothetical protein J0M33_17340 [Anaerolineae bacterium]|nr:hypothetical protein [Anaerolineae bacterium]
MSNSTIFLIQMFIISLLLLPVLTGIVLLATVKRPVGRLAGWLIAFPILNPLVGMNVGSSVIDQIAPKLGRLSPIYWIAVSIPGVIFLCYLAVRFYADWKAGNWPRWLGLSLLVILAHWALIPLLGSSLAYLVEFHSDLTGEEMTFAAQYGVPIVVLCFGLPMLNTLFTLWMIRRDARRPSST